MSIVLRLLLAVFSLSSTYMPATAQAPDTISAKLTPEILATIDAEVERSLAKVLKPTGPAVKNWPSVGIDMDRASLQKGGERRVFFEGDPDLPTVLAIGLSIDEIAPKGWLYSHSPDGVAAKATPGSTDTAVFRISPTRIAAVIGGVRVKGNARCSTPVFKIVYLDHPTGVGKAPVGTGVYVQLFLERYLQKLSTADLCVVAYPSKQSGFRMRSFTEDGRPLGELDKKARNAKLIPVGEIAGVLALVRDRAASAISLSAIRSAAGCSSRSPFGGSYRTAFPEYRHALPRYRGCARRDRG